MSTLLCFGFGYCAQHYVAEFGARFSRIIGTTRTAQRASELAGERFGGRPVEMLALGADAANGEAGRAVVAAVQEADALLVSARPADGVDPCLAMLANAILRAPGLRSVVLLSTLGVYGDHGGGWVSELTPPVPQSARGRARLDQEAAWERLGLARGLPVAILRLAGIYGPLRNALVAIKQGKARRIDKPGQVFNHIHVADIAQAIDASFGRRAAGVFNVADDEPTPPGDQTVFAAQLLGVDPPPELAFAEAAKTMTPMALSFYSDSRRATNDKMKRELGVALRYPTFREGLRALHLEMNEARAPHG